MKKRIVNFTVLANCFRNLPDLTSVIDAAPMAEEPTDEEVFVIESLLNDEYEVFFGELSVSEPEERHNDYPPVEDHYDEESYP